MDELKISKGTLQGYSGESRDVTIPDGVVKIASGGLGYNYDIYAGLDSVVLPDSVRNISNNAFISKGQQAMYADGRTPLKDIRVLYIPKKINMPKDYLKQEKFDLHVAMLLVEGPWRKSVTTEDCVALVKHFDQDDLPLFVINRAKSYGHAKRGTEGGF